MRHFFQFKTFKILAVILIAGFVIGFCMMDCEVDSCSSQTQIKTF